MYFFFAILIEKREVENGRRTPCVNPALWGPLSDRLSYDDPCSHTNHPVEIIPSTHRGKGWEFEVRLGVEKVQRTLGAAPYSKTSIQLGRIR